MCVCERELKEGHFSPQLPPAHLDMSGKDSRMASMSDRLSMTSSR